jgi:hypothetical protein
MCIVFYCYFLSVIVKSEVIYILYYFIFFYWILLMYNYIQKLELNSYKQCNITIPKLK